MGGPGARIAAGPGDVDELEEVCERAGGLRLTPYGRSMRFDISNMRRARKRPSDGEARSSHHITLYQAGTMMSASFRATRVRTLRANLVGSMGRNRSKYAR